MTVCVVPAPFDLTAGSVCSGHGACSLALDNTATCECDWMWTGKSDMFDLDGVACQNPVVLDRIFWILAFVAYLVLFVRGLRLLKRMRASSGGMKKGARMVGFQVFVAMPVLMTALLLRGASTQKTGVDLPVTILMSLGIGLQACGGWINQAYLFEVLVMGAANLNAGTKASALVRRSKVVGVVANAFFIAVMFGTQIASVYTPVGVNSYRWGLVVTRNLGMALYFIVSAFYMNIQRKSCAALFKKTSSDGPVHRERKGDDLHETLAKFNELFAVSWGRLLVLVALLLVFLIPPLMAFNYVGSAIAITFAAGKSHIINYYVQKKGSHKSKHHPSHEGSKEISAHASKTSKEHSKDSKESSKGSLIVEPHVEL